MTFHSPTHKPNQTLEAYIRAQRVMQHVDECRHNVDHAVAAHKTVCMGGSTRSRSESFERVRAARCALIVAELRAGLKGGGE